MTTLNAYLSRAYAATHRLSAEQRVTVVSDLRAAMLTDPDLASQAQAELSRLADFKSHIEGSGSELSSRCAISAAHHAFLQDTFTPSA